MRLAAETQGRDGKPFALVLLDACMPGTDGLAVAEEIRRDPALRDTRILLMTSAGSHTEPERRRQLDITSHITKPVSHSALLDQIALAFGRMPPGSEVHARDEMELAAAGTRPMRLLLAEDNVVNQRVATRLLERWGHSVAVVGDGMQVLDALQRESFDAVLMDVQMPELDGLETTTRIRQQEKASGGHVPIIALTAHATQGDRAMCLQAGMDAYVAKPIRRQELARALNDVCDTDDREASPPSANEGPAETPAQQDTLAGGQTSGAPTEPAGELNDAESPFDKAAMVERLGGDADFLREIAALFVGDCPKRMAEIYDVIKGACGGWCWRTTVLWNDLNSAAVAKWGLGSAKYNHFFTQADSNGVNH